MGLAVMERDAARRRALGRERGLLGVSLDISISYLDLSHLL